MQRQTTKQTKNKQTPTKTNKHHKTPCMQQTPCMHAGVGAFGPFPRAPASHS